MHIDARVAAIAERQYGAVSHAQLAAVGVDRNLRRRRVASGRWRQASSRVIVIAGTPRSAEQELMVRVLHAGADGVASHQDAAWLWRVPSFVGVGAVTRGRPHGTTAAEAHRPRLLLPHHRDEVRGIPVTSLPRTIFDLAGLPLPMGRLVAIVDTVVTRSPAMLPALHRTLDELAQRGRPGIRSMRAVLAARPLGTRVPASGLERRFEAICRNAGIGRLERQVDVGGHSWLGRADYRNARLKLIVEIDSKLHHSSPTDVANDAARDEAMVAAGWRKVLRIWEEDLWSRPWLVVEQLRAAYAELEHAAA